MLCFLVAWYRTGLNELVRARFLERPIRPLPPIFSEFSVAFSAEKMTIRNRIGEGLAPAAPSFVVKFLPWGERNSHKASMLITIKRRLSSFSTVNHVKPRADRRSTQAFRLSDQCSLLIDRLFQTSTRSSRRPIHRKHMLLGFLRIVMPVFDLRVSGSIWRSR